MSIGIQKIGISVPILISIISATDYRSKIMNQRITHFENPSIDLNVRYFGDEGYPYILLKEDVTPYNDLHLMLYVRYYDGPVNLLVNAPISLCQLLHDKEFSRKLPTSQYNIDQIYNFSGKRCPIPKGEIRLSPYIFPSNFTVEADIGCGYMNLESRLMKCSDGIETESRICTTLLKTVSLVFLDSDMCERNSSIDDWVINNVSQYSIDT
ncbi:hypothetical protein QAD02_023703 [Eretmocerus hayati]|uniref:Uncharacterized protein n=1 Tax=Eretmocerus hayati TaxID=131215 RepID=A0ACC2PWN7_9HYME|nr:hypothetical protein QAD02_023703 [Eretmocerus hayati]